MVLGVALLTGIAASAQSSQTSAEVSSAADAYVDASVPAIDAAVPLDAVAISGGSGGGRRSAMTMQQLTPEQKRQLEAAGIISNAKPRSTAVAPQRSGADAKPVAAKTTQHAQTAHVGAVKKPTPAAKSTSAKSAQLGSAVGLGESDRAPADDASSSAFTFSTAPKEGSGFDPGSELGSIGGNLGFSANSTKGSKKPGTLAAADDSDNSDDAGDDTHSKSRHKGDKTAGHSHESAHSKRLQERKDEERQ